MYRVTCKQCRASAVTPDGNSDRLVCGCCPENHSHEANAIAGHVCRPCVIELTGPIRVGMG